MFQLIMQVYLKLDDTRISFKKISIPFTEIIYIFFIEDNYV